MNAKILKVYASTLEREVSRIASQHEIDNKKHVLREKKKAYGDKEDLPPSMLQMSGSYKQNNVQIKTKIK